MIFVPLLHYFKCKNQYSGNEDGMRYLLSPGKRSVPDPVSYTHLTLPTKLEV